MSGEEPPLGSYEAEDINRLVDRLLRDLGRPEPPLDLDQVRALQRLDLTYYSKTDLDLLDEMAHRARMAGSVILSTAKRMVEVVEQYGLRGLLMLKENEKRIFIDNDVVELKRRFLVAHEITHDLLPWHRALLLGDNEATLSPSCHQTMEAEANYGGRRLIFMGSRFQTEARDLPFTWQSVQKLKKRYGNTLTTTLWHMVCSRTPAHPVFGMISCHPHHRDIGDRGDGQDVAYFIRSDGFQAHFGNVSKADAFLAFRSYATTRRRGPVGEEVCILTNANGEPCDFHMYSFSNQHQILTLGVYLGPHRRVVGL